MKMLPLLALALCASCDGIPRDPDRTLDRVRAERQYRVGIIASGKPIGADRQRLFLNRVSAAAQAQPALETGAAEPLLAKLEEGELDLVLGPMAPHSPWSKMVIFLPPLGEQVTREGHIHLVAAARHGENAWITLLDAEAAKVTAIR